MCRTKRDLKAESNAKEISDGLPFLEYDLHKLLINKLRTKGMNAIFGLKVNLFCFCKKSLRIQCSFVAGNSCDRRENDGTNSDRYGCFPIGPTGTDSTKDCGRQFLDQHRKTKRTTTISTGNFRSKSRDLSVKIT